MAVTSGGVIPDLASVTAPAPVFEAEESSPLGVAVPLPAGIADASTIAAPETELLQTAGAIALELGSCNPSR